MPAIETTPELVQHVYDTTRKRLEIIKKRFGQPLTLTEKVLFGHLADPENEVLERVVPGVVPGPSLRVPVDHGQDRGGVAGSQNVRIAAVRKPLAGGLRQTVIK